jgi:hypothetical protein
MNFVKVHSKNEEARMEVGYFAMLLHPPGANPTQTGVGGFGVLLAMAYTWQPKEKWVHAMTLLAHEVMPQLADLHSGTDLPLSPRVGEGGKEGKDIKGPVCF